LEDGSYKYARPIATSKEEDVIVQTYIHEELLLVDGRPIPQKA
jgi:hypothetical protein